ncbi:MAG TPA: glutamate-5-semialdehyde dehydrogenase [Candidatus Nanopelagicaceae bacterium]|nr:glutamate-5-semialdehyde dehydrogenase [Candidatus Nanopelagicaceae bacterium]
MSGEELANSAVAALALRSREAAKVLAALSRAEKDAALSAMANAISENADAIVAANKIDVEVAKAGGAIEQYLDRLTLTPSRVEGIADGLRQLVDLPDPIGEVVRGSTLANGLEIRQIRVPFGVVGMVYEARPNVTVDAAGICLKSGNAVLLRGSSSAAKTNEVLVETMRAALTQTRVPEDAIQLVPSQDRDTVTALLTARGLVDLVIPRGGSGLIKMVVEEATVPVIETGVGNCHVYIDADADLDKALAIVINSKVQRPSVCNAAETLLVHEAVAAKFIPTVLAAFKEQNVLVHGDENFAAASGDVRIATDDDWAREYESLEIAAKVVYSLEEAVAHIRKWGSGHTEAIVTDSISAAHKFVISCDSAAVMVNASTRFTDGEQFGFGAEIGISTQKLHARGPMGLPEMTTTTWVVTGDGHIRA